MSHVAFSRTALLVAVAGCNPFYGLGETELIDAAEFVVVDRDEDGVLDVIDVCPDIANSLQEDMDGDRLGDACDPCPTGSNHNEDGDALLDGCDNCPQIANDDQPNVDRAMGDDLGDACDLDNQHPDVRTRFDGFDVLENDWIPGDVEWLVEMDTVHLAPVPSQADYNMWNRRLVVTGTKWMIETHFRAAAVDGVYGGIQTRKSDGAVQYHCFVQFDDSPSWRLGGAGASPPVVVPVTDGIRLRMYRDFNGIHCEANGVTLLLPPNVVIPAGHTHPGISANSSDVRFDYVEAVSTP